MKFIFALLLFVLGAQAFAMKSRERTFNQPCDVVWKAAVAVAKSQEYRIVSISQDEHVISLVAGGWWNGERIISLSLAPGREFGCTAKAQSRFSGLIHSDGPDLLSRIGVEVIGEVGGRDSKAFQQLHDCMENAPGGDNSRCEEKYSQQLAKEHKADAIVGVPASAQSKDNQWWQSPNPPK